MLVTTYQHDYVPPHTRRYEFIKHTQSQNEKYNGPTKDVCQCIDEPTVQPPKSAMKECEALEWSGIAPMGRLLNPRIIPAKLTEEQIEKLATEAGIDCFKEQPNRFLQALSSLYPDLYDKLKQMPKEEMSKRLENDRLHTTYQIDYCHMSEYPEGVYESLKTAEDTVAITDRKLLHPVDPCAEFRNALQKQLARDGGADINTDACEKSYKPMKITFADSSRFINSGNNSHWRGGIFKKQANISEYMDVISRNGCVIMKNRVHDHAKCTKNYCKHPLKKKCIHIEKE